MGVSELCKSGKYWETSSVAVRARKRTFGEKPVLRHIYSFFCFLESSDNSKMDKAALFSLKVDGVTNQTSIDSLREVFSKFGNVGKSAHYVSQVLSRSHYYRMFSWADSNAS